MNDDEDPMLPLMTDEMILSLDVSYDDGTLEEVVRAYVELRHLYLAMLEAM